MIKFFLIVSPPSTSNDIVVFHKIVQRLYLRIFLAKLKIVLYIHCQHASPVINQGNKNLAWSVITQVTFQILLKYGHVIPVSMT